MALLEASGTPAASRSSASSRRAGASKAAASRKTGGGPQAGYRIAELYIERRGGRSIVGNIYKGKVDNVLPGLEAAFVDIGLEKNGFLHVDEIVLPGVETPKRGRGSGSGRKISDLLKPGQEIVVQVVKDPLKTKGARLSMELTIAGRYMVYAPTGEGIGVSRRLEDKERERLRRQTSKLEIGGGGVIVRTAAHGAKREDFERELKYLHKLHEVLVKRVEETVAPDLVFQEADLSVRVVRDIFSAHFERAIVDDEQQYHRLVSFFTRTAPELVERVELWQQEQPLFEAYGVDKAIEGVLSRRVDLPSGGYLIIDYAEALTVIDVNSGSFIGRGKGAGLEDTITKTNLEAAEEVVNQLRLRDIGGIIVIDFIDMARARNRDAVMKVLRKTLDEDRTKTFTAEISKLGLVEMTRQNVTEGVREIMSRPCPTCEGEGVIRSEETIAIEFERKLRDVAAEQPRRRCLPRADQPARDGRVHRPRLARAGSARGETRASRSCSRAPKASRSTTSRSPSRARARRSRSARCRSARATRCWSRSSSRTCTTRKTPWPKSTATSSRSRAPRRTWAQSAWCASTRSAARPPARCCSTSRARSSRPRRARQAGKARKAGAVRLPPRAVGVRASARGRERAAGVRRPTARTPTPVAKQGCTSRRRQSTPSPRKSSP